MCRSYYGKYERSLETAQVFNYVAERGALYVANYCQHAEGSRVVPPDDNSTVFVDVPLFKEKLREALRYLKEKQIIV